MLCVMFINDIDSTVVISLLKFADDTKILRQVPEVEYAFTLHEDLLPFYVQMESELAATVQLH